MSKVSANETTLWKIVQSLRELWDGRSNAPGSCTLSANAATTVVNAINCGADSTVTFTPRTAHAAAEIGNGTMYVSAVTNGGFTITHANNAQTDRTFDYAIQG